jgi:23S rRNA pseudouridine2605 synthase
LAGPDEPVRLNRYLAMVGVASRRSCDRIVQEGRVTVNGVVERSPGRRIRPGEDRVALDGKPLDGVPRRVVLLVHKPRGVVTTVSDPAGRPTVIELCRRFRHTGRLFPVGRLDINTTGALLLTNDGWLCYRLTHPRFGVPRIYRVRVHGRFDEKKRRWLERLGSEGQQDPKRRAQVRLVHLRGKHAVLEVTLREGRNRQVRRMCERAGLIVEDLVRVAFGPISIRGLPEGMVRPLTKKEMENLERAIDRGG